MEPEYYNFKSMTHEFMVYYYLNWNVIVFMKEEPEEQAVEEKSLQQTKVSKWVLIYINSYHAYSMES